MRKEPAGGGRGEVGPGESGAPFPQALFILAGIYLYSLLLALSRYGDPFPFFGTFYQEEAAQRLVFADTLICLYLFLGIVKRQRLTVWLLVGYNTLDLANALFNLAWLPLSVYAQLAGGAVPEEGVAATTAVAGCLLMLLNLYVFANRRHFTNRSLYLF